MKMQKSAPAGPKTQKVNVLLDSKVSVNGDLLLPEQAKGLVIFAHGSGRLGPDNWHLARILYNNNFACLLFDLLTDDEAEFDEKTEGYRDQFVMLGDRMVSAVICMKEERDLRHLGLGIFGDSSGACAALIAAARLPKAVKAVVSRSGRLHLDRPIWEHVSCPTLLLCGDRDQTLAENDQAVKVIRGEKKLQIVDDCDNLLTDDARLDDIGQSAVDWFTKYLHMEDPETIGATITY